MTATLTTSPFLTLHALQAFGPSLLNRDDAGATKQIVIGDAPRVRISAQSLRRAIRTALRQDRLDDFTYASRSSRFPALAAEILVAEHGRPADIAAAKVAAVFDKMKINLAKSGSGNTAVRIFAPEAFPAAVAAAVNTAWDQIGDKVPSETVAAAIAALDPGRALDLVLFGRMLAEVPQGGRVDGAVGVAHGFSVDAAAIEPDFWTAVDDAAPEGEAASGNLGVSMVSAPVIYRQASLDRRHLRALLDGQDDAETLAVAAEAAFVEWFIRAVPSAKQRSSVAATLPSVVIASTGPQVQSAANAFTAPVTGDVMTEATHKLLAACDRTIQALGQGALTVLTTDPAVDAAVAGQDSHQSISAFVAALGGK